MSEEEFDKAMKRFYVDESGLSYVSEDGLERISDNSYDKTPDEDEKVFLKWGRDASFFMKKSPCLLM